MKRCPSCNRTYTHATQKFCTQDGTPLVDMPPAGAQGETIRIDSARLQSTQLEDELTKPISRELVSPTGDFDPYKTVVNSPPDTSARILPETQALTPSTQLPPDSGSLPGKSTGPLEPLPPLPPPPPPIQPSSSGPIAPPVQRASSGPIATPFSGPITPPTAAQSPAPAPIRAKKSKLPLVLGILAVLLLIGVGAVGVLYWFVARPMLEASRVIVEPTPAASQTPIAKATPEPTKSVVEEVPPYSPPSNAVEFRNSSDNLDGKLKEHFVDFSFYYPESWQKDPKAGVPGATNFARVERGLPPDYTLESFAVGWYASAGSAEADRVVFPRLTESLSSKFEKTISDYRKFSENERKVGPYNGYEFRFEGLSQITDKGQFKIWGVAIFLPPVDGGKNGVTLLMLATSLAPELKSADDVGVKGQLPMMLESFRFGNNARQ